MALLSLDKMEDALKVSVEAYQAFDIDDGTFRLALLPPVAYDAMAV